MSRFNPRQAQEDQYALFLAIFAIFGLAVAYALWAVGPGGSIYWLLSLNGQQAEAVVESADLVVPADEDGRRAFRNTNALGDYVLLRYSFRDGLGDDRVGEAFYRVREDVSHRVPEAASQGETLPVVYWVRDPGVSMPLNLLPTFRFDGLALLWASGAAVILAGLSVVAIRRWIAFRASAARY